MPNTLLATEVIESIQLAEQSTLTVISADAIEPIAGLVVHFLAGSHDEPQPLIGLAHFLEHLVFRGSQNYSAADGLMPFVQAAGGSVNAQTQAHRTSFHFQLPIAQLLAASQRLVDMLCNPLFAADTLASEREVIEQEYQLYQGHPLAQMQAALALSIQAPEELRWFRCGNRQTLAIEQTDFLTRLQQFHQEAYLTSPLQMVLCCNAADWQLIKADFVQLLQPLLQTTRSLPQAATPILLRDHRWLEQTIAQDPQAHLLLQIPLADQAGQLDWLVQLLQYALSQQPELAQLLGYQSVTCRVAYSSGSQGILVIDFNFASAQQLTEQLIASLLTSLTPWLVNLERQLASVEPLQLQQTYHNHWQMLSPLKKGMQWLRQQHLTLDLQRQALVELIEALQQQQLVIQRVNASQSVSNSFDQGLPVQAQAFNQSLPQQCAQIALPASNILATQPPLTPLAEAFSEFVAKCSSKQPTSAYLGWQVGSNSWALTALQQRLKRLQAVFAFQGVQSQAFYSQGYVFVQLTCAAAFLQTACRLLLGNFPLSVNYQPPAAPPAAKGLRDYMQQIPQRLLQANFAAPSDQVFATTPDQLLLMGFDQQSQRLSSQCWATEPLQRITSQLPSLPSYSLTSLADLFIDLPAPGKPISSNLVLVLPLAGAVSSKVLAGSMGQWFSQRLLGQMQLRLRQQLGLCYALTCELQYIADQPYLMVATQTSAPLKQIYSELQQLLSEPLTADEHQQLSEHLQAHAQRLQNYQLPLDELQRMYFGYWLQQHSATIGYQTDLQALTEVSQSQIAAFFSYLQSATAWWVFCD